CSNCDWLPVHLADYVRTGWLAGERVCSNKVGDVARRADHDLTLEGEAVSDRLAKNIYYFCLGPITFWTNTSNRGSPRSGSSQGSTLIRLMLRPSWSTITCSNQRIASSRFPRLR